MTKKEIKAYIKKQLIEKEKELNTILSEQSDNANSDTISASNKKQDELEKEIYILLYFEVVVANSKYKQSSIKLLKHDFEEINETTIDKIVEKVKETLPDDFSLKKYKKDKQLNLMEKVIKKILFYYHDYTGFEEGKYGKF